MPAFVSPVIMQETEMLIGQLSLNFRDIRRYTAAGVYPEARNRKPQDSLIIEDGESKPCKHVCRNRIRAEIRQRAIPCSQESKNKKGAFISIFRFYYPACCVAKSSYGPVDFAFAEYGSEKSDNLPPVNQHITVLIIIPLPRMGKQISPIILCDIGIVEIKKKLMNLLEH